ncbi:acyl-CoA desaturase 1 [[Candida] jaroonii]|uniref:Acyl-CoA desaturase 1 n=1 Tax=[Candida] jaroonii TaxID=467808 RepID=A0ACA9Y934_9ASCO|nr:acyl-CoA desaturase 1 [[Candida] jaroonii]
MAEVRYRVKKKKDDRFNNANQLKNSKIKEMGKRKRDFLKRINYKHFFTVLICPLFAIIYLIKYSESILPKNTQTFWFSVFYFNFTILAFTSGYHKFFTHNAFVTKNNLLIDYFTIFGSSMGLGSIKWWGSLHRAHHQFTDDVEKDPYSIKRGFLYSHFGWIIMRPKVLSFYNELFDEFCKITIENEVETEIFDNEIDKEFIQEKQERLEYSNNIKLLMQWQDKWYFVLFVLTTLVIPALVTKFYCEDSLINGIIYPGILRMFLCQQSLLSTESICHFKEIQITIPSQPFNDSNSSINCNNPLMAIITYGQSKQNFHHEFPHDYRNDSSKVSFDPTKWFLNVLEKLRVITDVSITPKDLVTQLRIQQRQKVLNKLKSQLNWGTPISKLPLIKPDEFKRLISTSAHKDRIYIVISNIIHDITPFMDQHPGGVPLLKASHGKDATKAFFGGVYSHSTAASNLLATMRIGYLDLGNEEEVWDKIVVEEGEDTTQNQRQYESAEAA